MIARQIGRHDLAGVFAFALVVRLGALVALQPRLGADGVGFLAAAHTLRDSGPAALSGLPLQHAPLYSVLVSLATFVPLDTAWLITVIQALAGAATAAILARLTARETGSRLVGLCVGCLAAIHITFVFWTVYVLSETFFLLLLAYAADRALQFARSQRPLFEAFGLGVLTLVGIAARPTGASFALAVLVSLLLVARRRRLDVAPLVAAHVAPFLAIGVLATLVSVIVPSASVLAQGGRVVDWVRSGVENGLLETPTGRATSGVDLDVFPPPIVETLPADQRAEFLDRGPIAFATGHPEFVVRQSLLKLLIFWTPVLPEYSLVHALMSSAYFIGLYVLAILGLVHQPRASLLVTFCLLNVVLFTATSLVTIVDYDQRYRLPVELFLIPLAGIGLAGLYHVLERKVVRRDRACVGRKIE